MKRNINKFATAQSDTVPASLECISPTYDIPNDKFNKDAHNQNIQPQKYDLACEHIPTEHIDFRKNEHPNTNWSHAQTETLKEAFTHIKRGAPTQTTHQLRIPRVLFLDLDNTLIPTTWMMNKWRKPFTKEGNVNEESHKRIQTIERALDESGLYIILERLFKDLYTNGNIDEIAIVTNAGKKTVDSFYLTMCLPKLKNLVEKYKIGVFSTESWVGKLGPPPAQTCEEAFRDFYTDVKFYEFSRLFENFMLTAEKRRYRNLILQEPVPRRQSCRKANAHTNSDTQTDVYQTNNQTNSVKEDRVLQQQPIQIDLISCGDQMCEISAACRLAQCYSGNVRLTKVLIICDIEENRFSHQTPETFVQQLEDLRINLLALLHTDEETIDEHGVAHWVPVSTQETFLASIAAPKRFMESYPRYLENEDMVVCGDEERYIDEEIRSRQISENNIEIVCAKAV